MTQMRKKIRLLVEGPLGGLGYPIYVRADSVGNMKQIAVDAVACHEMPRLTRPDTAKQEVVPV